MGELLVSATWFLLSLIRCDTDIIGAVAYRFPKAQERLEELRKSGTKGPRPANGKLTRKDQKKDEAECTVM